jgi:hypothetical protein
MCVRARARLSELGTHSRRLERLMLPRLGLTARGVEALLTQAGATLTAVDLSGNDDGVGDPVLFALGRHCPLLARYGRWLRRAWMLVACAHAATARLALDYCGGVTDLGVFSLTVSCHGLVSLSLSHCGALTDQALGDIGLLPRLAALMAKHSPEYGPSQALHACACPRSRSRCAAMAVGAVRFTAGGVARLLSRGRALRHVDVSYCTRIWAEQMPRLRAMRRDVVLVAQTDWMPRGGRP